MKIYIRNSEFIITKLAYPTREDEITYDKMMQTKREIIKCPYFGEDISNKDVFVTAYEKEPFLMKQYDEGTFCIPLEQAKRRIINSAGKK